MRPTTNDRFVCTVQGASASLRFATQQQAETAREKLLAERILSLDSAFEYREERLGNGESFQQPIRRDVLPPIYMEDGLFALHVPLDKHEQAETFLADMALQVVLPKNTNAQLIFEGRYAALNAHEKLVKTGIISGASDTTEMRRESQGGAAAFEYVIEVPREKTAQALACLEDIRGLPTNKGTDAGHIR